MYPIYWKTIETSKGLTNTTGRSVCKRSSMNSSMETSFLGGMYVWPTPGPQMYEWCSADDCSLPQVERRNNAINKISYRETQKGTQPMYFKRWRLIDVKKLLSISFLPKGQCKKVKNDRSELASHFMIYRNMDWSCP